MRQRNWQGWVTQLLADLEGDSEEKNQIFQYGMNVFTLLHWHCFVGDRMEGDNPESAQSDVTDDVDAQRAKAHHSATVLTHVLRHSLRVVQVAWKNTAPALRHCRLLLQSLMSKVKANKTVFPHTLDSTTQPMWANLLELLNMVRVYMFCTPTLGKSQPDEDKRMSSAVRFGDMVTYDLHWTAEGTVEPDDHTIAKTVVALLMSLNPFSHLSCSTKDYKQQIQDSMYSPAEQHFLLELRERLRFWFDTCVLLKAMEEFRPFGSPAEVQALVMEFTSPQPEKVSEPD